MARASCALGVVVAMLLALSGCSIPDPTAEPSPPQASIKVGAAKPSNKKVLVLQPTGCVDTCASEYTRPSQWPEACGLIDQGEIRAVLPEATDISMTPEDQNISIGPRHQIRGSPVGVATKSECLISLHLPGGLRGTIWVKDIAVGGAEAVKANYQGHLEDARTLSQVAVRTDLGPAECFTSEGPTAAKPSPEPTTYDNLWHLDAEWECYQTGRYATIGYAVSGPDLRTSPGRATFTHGGRTTAVTSAAAARAHVADSITADLARSVSAAIS